MSRWPILAMGNDAATVIIINPKKRHTAVAARFGRTLDVGKHRYTYRLPHPEIPAHPHGSSSHAIMYALGHSEGALAPLISLSPAILRQLRALAYRQRVRDGHIHLFGILDNESPFGSRRALELAIRFFKPTQVKLCLHIGVWHPTPSEFSHGLNEVKTLCNETVTLTSLFPVQSILQPEGARAYIDGILHPHSLPHPSALSLPLAQPLILANPEVTDNDDFLLINHSLHGLDTLRDVLEQSHHLLGHLDFDHPVSQHVQQSLDQSKHIMLLTTAPSYEEAYLGTGMRHPYYESVYVDSPVHLFEMLVSPHFGYHKPPYRTIVLADEPQSPTFDWLLSSFIKQNYTQPYYCCFLEPENVHGSLVMTNIEPRESLHTHRYAAYA